MIDPKTGRPVGDHGTAMQAIDYALSGGSEVWAQEIEFLRAWRAGDLDEWPEFYEWLKVEDRDNG